MTYKYYQNRPEKLTKEFVEAEYAKLIARIGAAETSESSSEWISLYNDWNALSAYISGEGSRVSYARSKDMTNKEIDVADKYYREEVTPAGEDGAAKLLDALLKSKHKQAIGNRYGSYLIDSLMTQVEPLAPVNSELRVKVNDLIDKYDLIVSAGEVDIEGKKVTLAVARSLQKSSNAATRKAAFVAYREWFLAHHDEIAKIYDEMVHARDQMGRNLGHKNYIPLGYNWMRRTDYGPKEAAAFRNNVREYAVPLMKRLHEEHAAALGTPTLKPWDSGYHPAFTLPSGVAPIDQQLQKAQEVFNEISPRLAKHFTRMVNEGLIDLENRKGKRAGAYCTSMPDEGRVAIFCNSTGDADDVGTLMHEMGHAFQAWESQPIEAIDLQWPTSDAAEVHSMGMEFLAMPKLTRFFSNENVKKFQREHFYDVISLMCYISIVDEFQHWVYENPNASIAERDQAWSRIWDIYLPGLDFTGVEQYKYARWYSQGHIFQTPFYYIDYAIAQTGALQLGMMDEQDHEKALDTYLRLCVIGGTKSVLNIFKEAGLRSPFDPATMRDLMDYAAKSLGVGEMAEAA